MAAAKISNCKFAEILCVDDTACAYVFIQMYFKMHFGRFLLILHVKFRYLRQYECQQMFTH